MRKPEFEVGWGCKGRKIWKNGFQYWCWVGGYFFQWINLNLRFMGFFLLDRRSTLTCKRPTKNSPCTRIFTWPANTNTFHTLIFQQGMYISGSWFKGHSAISCSKISKTYEQHVFQKRDLKLYSNPSQTWTWLGFSPLSSLPTLFFFPELPRPPFSSIFAPAKTKICQPNAYVLESSILDYFAFTDRAVAFKVCDWGGDVRWWKRNLPRGAWSMYIHKLIQNNQGLGLLDMGVLKIRDTKIQVFSIQI